MKESVVNVILVDDTEFIRDSLELSFSHTKKIRLIAYARSGEQAIPLFGHVTADVALVDILLPGMGGFDVARRALSADPKLRVLFFTATYTPAYVKHAKELGAAGWIVKESMPELIETIIRVARGCPFVAPPSGRPALPLPVVSAMLIPKEGKEALTEREIEIVRLWTAGFEVKEIAEKLGITPRTVETHRAHIIHKTGTRSSAQLMKLALAQGWISL